VKTCLVSVPARAKFGVAHVLVIATTFSSRAIEELLLSARTRAKLMVNRHIAPAFSASLPVIAFSELV
jgi:hypothetical protein